MTTTADEAAQERADRFAPRHQPETITEVCTAWARAKRVGYHGIVPAHLARALDALLQEHMQA